MPEPAENVALAFVQAISAGDLETLRKLMTDDHTFTDALGNSISGAEKMYSGWQHFLYAYPEYRITIVRSFASEDEVALFGAAQGKWRVGERVLPQTWRVAAAWLAKVQSGKIQRWSVFCDTGWAKPPANS